MIFTEKSRALLNSVRKFIEIEAWLHADFFYILTQLFKFYTCHCHVLKSADDLNKVIRQIDRK